MATTIFLNSTGSNSDYTRYEMADQVAAINGTLMRWAPMYGATTTAGGGQKSSITPLVTGPTDGVQAIGTVTYITGWVTPPLTADVTISGSITFNLHAYENSMSANASINCQVERIGPTQEIASTVIKTVRTTELGTSSNAANWSETPTSTNFYKGDRILIRLFFDDAGTMASGYNGYLWFGNATPGGDGYAYLTFTETISLLGSVPTGTTIYPTATASDVDTAAVDQVAWTSRGGGAQTIIVNTATGWTDPIQMTNTAGGTVVDWWTPQLESFTLGGAVYVNTRPYVSSSSANATLKCEIAVCNGDGSSPSVWASHVCGLEITATSEISSRVMIVSGPDTSVSAGKRLRIRFYIDDSANTSAGGLMVSGYTTTLVYAGSEGASGDTYLAFTNTLVAQEVTPPDNVLMPYFGGGYYPS